jgi:hypothetical protein
MKQVEWDLNGIKRTVEGSADGETLTITREQDCQPVLDYNAFLRGLGSSHWRGADNDFWHYARVPIMELEKYAAEKGHQALQAFLSGESDDMIKWIETEAPYLKVGEFSLMRKVKKDQWRGGLS